MFNRDNNYSLPNPFGSRPPQRDGYSRTPQGYPPQHGGPDVGGYGTQPPRRPAPGARPPPTQAPRPSEGGSWNLTPKESPNKDFQFGNIVALSPQDFPPSSFGRDDIPIIVNGLYVFSARRLDGFPQGYIGMSSIQRPWAKAGLRDSLDVQIYDPFRQGGEAYLGSADIEVKFAGRTRTDALYDQDELGSYVIKNFESQIFAPGQPVLMDHHGIPLQLTVKTILRVSLVSEKETSKAPETEPTARGILTKHTLINFFKEAQSDIQIKPAKNRPAANAIIQPDFNTEKMGIGGLDSEFHTIFRRAFASRIFPPDIVAKLGIQHVKGILLFGPPGTGKTLLARQIGKMLNAREPKIINGPEVLNKFVGQSEENIRKLFADAEQEYKEKGDESGLHIIIFDELDAVCKQRGSTGGGTGVGDSVVNQLLSKMDGVDQLNNILLIGMTNRKDMIDDALLRPGRLEVHVEISLPDEAGRAQILGIHTQNMRQTELMDPSVDLPELAALTKNYSGAEIAGLVKAATSFAFNRHIDTGKAVRVKDDAPEMRVNHADFIHALDEIQPAFGVSEDEIRSCIEHDIINYSERIDAVLKEGEALARGLTQTGQTPLWSILLNGGPGSGKTALAAQIALESGSPFIKMICPEDIAGLGEMAKIQHILRVFNDAYKSQTSVVVVDEIETLVDYVSVGPRFSNNVLQTLKVLIKKRPPKNRRLLVLATTSERALMKELNIYNSFNSEIDVPNVTTHQELKHVMEESGAFTPEQIGEALTRIEPLKEQTAYSVTFGVGIKKVFDGIELAKKNPNELVNRFVRSINSAVQEGGVRTSGPVETRRVEERRNDEEGGFY
ncbi:P-loop containing nucleoside triphosphate hydrolase protein [Aspergillus cavernicola]|uniref:Vesicular-fusion protein SEC18 n=1 Tax=Aspergillus cavernicola TaxID=176166 RepID=A0ABR4J4R1_9EURO